jgi:hypothetical protein
MTATTYTATPEQWASVEATQATAERDFNSGSSDTAILVACILELRARVEAMEASAFQWSDHFGQVNKMVGGSLLERVASAIHPDRCADPNLYLHEARAAICEVAAWVLEHQSSPGLMASLESIAGLLLQEAAQ